MAVNERPAILPNNDPIVGSYLWLPESEDIGGVEMLSASNQIIRDTNK
jgi:hypothetical protein